MLTTSAFSSLGLSVFGASCDTILICFYIESANVKNVAKMRISPFLKEFLTKYKRYLERNVVS